MGGLRRRVGGLTMPADTADQAVCTVGKTNSHRSPDHTTKRADVKWNSLGPQANLLMHPSGLTRSVSPAWLDRVGKRPSVKAHLIYSNCVTVSGQCLSVVIIISNKMYFNSCVNWDGFPKSSHISHKMWMWMLQEVQKNTNCNDKLRKERYWPDWSQQSHSLCSLHAREKWKDESFAQRK